jgi:tRNA pseudouridine32 synthase / 23S rRNA pseudouridine746 synthase
MKDELRYNLQNCILFEDAEALVLNKPAGLDVTKPRSGATSVEGLSRTLAFGFHRWPTPVHRLDRDTTGCLLLARTERAHKRFQQAFEGGLVTKTYLALVEGLPTEDGGVIDMPLAKISSAQAGWRMAVSDKGKAARTHWTLLGSVDGCGLVEFRPETGRTHQLRVHAVHGLGAAIVGDPVYGRAAQNGRMMLHASQIIVPRDGKPAIDVSAPLPPGFAP